MRYQFSDTLYLWSAQESWHFVNLPADISLSIFQVSAVFRRGFGSVRVDVTCGSSNWRTSVFPDAKSGCFILPVKAQVRNKKNLKAGDSTHFEIELAEF